MRDRSALQEDAATASGAAHFEFYGLSLRVSTDWDEVRRSLALDFAWFDPGHAAPGQPDVEVRIERGPPALDSFGELPAAFVTPRNVVYQEPGRTIIEYFGRAVSILDRETGNLVVRGDDEGLVHEAAYQFILSRVGAHVDARGWTRLHGLGLSGPRGGTVVMLPSGGGKTTLGLRALRDDGIRVISEDTPLVDRQGMLHPFVLRIGINETDADRLGIEDARRLERMEFRPKLAIEVETFADRIEREPQPMADLVIGRRTLGNEPRLEPMPRRAALGALLREGVVGVGVYQGMEFVLQHGMRDTVGKVGVAASRAACCAAALRRARVWSFTVGRDEERNWEALRGLIV
jgi:hypothetical protein